MVKQDYSKSSAIIRLNEAGDLNTKESALIYNWIKQRSISYKEFVIMLDYIKERERKKFS